MIKTTLRPDLMEPVNWTDLVLIQAFPYAVLIATITVWTLAIAAFIKRGRQKPDPRILRNKFMSKGEWDFGRLLEHALPDHQVHAKVAIEALLDNALRRKRFLRSIVDFVVLQRTTARIIALIELDNRPAVMERDRDRDQLLTDAGYRLIRFDGLAELPSCETIEADILGNFPGSRPKQVMPGAQIIPFPWTRRKRRERLKHHPQSTS